MLNITHYPRNANYNKEILLCSYKIVKIWNINSVSKKNAHSLLVQIQNGTVTLEDSLAVSCKAKCSFNISSSCHIPWYLPKMR